MSTHFVAGGNGDLSESQGKHSGDPPMEGYGEVRFIEVEGNTKACPGFSSNHCVKGPTVWTSDAIPAWLLRKKTCQ